MCPFACHIPGGLAVPDRYSLCRRPGHLPFGSRQVHPR